jgi:hypothetical protein
MELNKEKKIAIALIIFALLVIPGIVITQSVRLCQEEKRSNNCFSLFIADFRDLFRTQNQEVKEPEKSPSLVTNSAWDASVYQVQNYLRDNLLDPNSIEYIEWSPVVENDDGTYLVRVKYRAKNSFGGYVIKNQIFTLDQEGKVTTVVDHPEGAPL